LDRMMGYNFHQHGGHASSQRNDPNQYTGTGPSTNRECVRQTVQIRLHQSNKAKYSRQKTLGRRGHSQRGDCRICPRSNRKMAASS
jgi:hypothetical protein